MPTAPSRSQLHAFTALPSHTVSVLAPRRHPAATEKMGNGKNHISIFTSNGFQSLSTGDYSTAVQTLAPDIAILMADFSYGSVTPQSKRAVRMAERTEDWIGAFFSSVTPETTLRARGVSVFAPTLPVPYPIQWQYLNYLSELRDNLAGLAVYDTAILPDLKDYPALEPLPRLSLDTVSGPHQILHHIALGADVIIPPFVNDASEAGVALTFVFPPPATERKLPLGMDLSNPEHRSSLAPLHESCPCYTCTTHHRAYVHHLLDAKEMLAWTLLQLHNYHVVSAFFAGVRASLRAGGQEAFREECRRFALAYDAELPAGGAVRPRIRGYHSKSEGGDERRNRPAWGGLDAVMTEAKAGGADLGGDKAAVTGKMTEDAACSRC